MRPAPAGFRHPRPVTGHVKPSSQRRHHHSLRPSLVQTGRVTPTRARWSASRSRRASTLPERATGHGTPLVNREGDFLPTPTPCPGHHRSSQPQVNTPGGRRFLADMPTVRDRPSCCPWCGGPGRGHFADTHARQTQPAKAVASYGTSRATHPRGDFLPTPPWVHAWSTRGRSCRRAPSQPSGRMLRRCADATPCADLGGDISPTPARSVLAGDTEATHRGAPWVVPAEPAPHLVRWASGSCGTILCGHVVPAEPSGTRWRFGGRPVTHE